MRAVRLALIASTLVSGAWAYPILPEAAADSDDPLIDWQDPQGAIVALIRGDHPGNGIDLTFCFTPDGGSEPSVLAGSVFRVLNDGTIIPATNNILFEWTAPGHASYVRGSLGDDDAQFETPQGNSRAAGTFCEYVYRYDSASSDYLLVLVAKNLGSTPESMGSPVRIYSGGTISWIRFTNDTGILTNLHLDGAAVSGSIGSQADSADSWVLPVGLAAGGLAELHVEDHLYWMFPSYFAYLWPQPGVRALISPDGQIKSDCQVVRVAWRYSPACESANAQGTDDLVGGPGTYHFLNAASATVGPRSAGTILGIWVDAPLPPGLRPIVA